MDFIECKQTEQISYLLNDNHNHINLDNDNINDNDNDNINDNDNDNDNDNINDNLECSQYYGTINDTNGINIIGYYISGHPMGPNKKWVNKNKSLEEKQKKAIKYLVKLNNLTTPITPIIKYFTYNGIIKRRKHGFSVKDTINYSKPTNIYFIEKGSSIKQNYTVALDYYNRLILSNSDKIEILSKVKNKKLATLKKNKQSKYQNKNKSKYDSNFKPESN